MSQAKSGTNRDSANNGSTSAKARQATAKVTAPASQAADKAAEKSGDVASAARGAGERTAEAGSAVVRGAAERVQAVVAASGQAVTLARTAWTVIAQRKLLAAGVGAGLSALGATSYLAGHRAGRRTHGPITRLTGGRI
ncbi:hypothetical protein ACFY8K_15410 [Streptomyces misionensis]|uniref:hypothetical protein n=1 Tax=Streptomyces misionensis TaxID=67331 RepID=UPI0036BD610B